MIASVFPYPHERGYRIPNGPTNREAKNEPKQEITHGPSRLTEPAPWAETLAAELAVGSDELENELAAFRRRGPEGSLPVTRLEDAQARPDGPGTYGSHQGPKMSVVPPARRTIQRDGHDPAGMLD